MNDRDNPIERVKGLIAQDKVTEARDYLVQICHSDPDDLDLQINAAIIMFNEQWLNADTLEIIDRCLEGKPDSGDLWFMCAHTCFALETGSLDEQRGIDAAIQAIKLNPKNLQSYQTLIYIYLLQQRFWEAYLACRAMAVEAGVDNEVGKSLMSFSLRMTDPEPTPHVGFVLDGEQLRYTIQTVTSSSITSSICHFGGKIHEHGELRYAREFVGQADNILEVGTWSGNHTAYFLRFLVPSRYVGVDKDPIHAEITRKVAFLNKSAGVPCKVDVLNIWPDSACGSIQVRGLDVPRRPLDQIVEGPWNFIRVDVDGAEIDVFEGAEGILLNNSPKLMVCIKERLGNDVIEWLKGRGYSLVNTITDGTKHNHFLDKTHR